MLADVLVIAVLVGAVWWWQSRVAEARTAADEGEFVSLLGYDDLPPIGAFEPLPAEGDLDAYVEGGLAEIDCFLTGRDQTA